MRLSFIFNLFPPLVSFCFSFSVCFCFSKFLFLMQALSFQVIFFWYSEHLCCLKLLSFRSQRFQFSVTRDYYSLYRTIITQYGQAQALSSYLLDKREWEIWGASAPCERVVLRFTSIRKPNNFSRKSSKTTNFHFTNWEDERLRMVGRKKTPLLFILVSDFKSPFDCLLNIHIYGRDKIQCDTIHAMTLANTGPNSHW